MENIPFTLNNKARYKELSTAIMPFGKYKGRLVKDLPEFYLVWLNRQGFPKGKMGDLLSTMYEVRLNGLEYLLKVEK